MSALRAIRDFFFKPVPPAPGYSPLVIPTGTTAVPIVPLVVEDHQKRVEKIVAETRSIVSHDPSPDEQLRIEKQRLADLEARRRRANEEDEEEERQRARRRAEDDDFNNTMTAIAAIEIASSIDTSPSPSYDPTPSFDAGGGSFGGGGASGDW